MTGLVSGTDIKRFDYDPYGNQISADESENPYRYCGEYTDVETGYVYLRARYYDPEIGGFISVDPAKDGGNWYAYCEGNPIGLVDPSGLVNLLAYVHNKVVDHISAKYGFRKNMRVDYEYKYNKKTKEFESCVNKKGKSKKHGFADIVSWDGFSSFGYVWEVKKDSKNISLTKAQNQVKNYTHSSNYLRKPYDKGKGIRVSLNGGYFLEPGSFDCSLGVDDYWVNYWCDSDTSIIRYSYTKQTDPEKVKFVAKTAVTITVGVATFVVFKIPVLLPA